MFETEVDVGGMKKRRRTLADVDIFVRRPKRSELCQDLHTESLEVVRKQHSNFVGKGAPAKAVAPRGLGGGKEGSLE